MIIGLDSMSLMATDKFVKDFTVDRYKFNSALAKQQLSHIWRLEMMILEKTPDYRQLLKEKDLGELHPTEVSSVVYDNLGHNCLCVLKMSPKWVKYILENHLEEVLTLSEIGSWAAREILENENLSDQKPSTSVKLSERFFIGDDELHNSLKRLYGYQ